MLVRGCVIGALVSENHKAGLCTGWLFHIPALHAIHGHIASASRLAKIGGQLNREGYVRLLGRGCLHDDVGAGDILGVEPQVPGSPYCKGHIIILFIVFANV